jgi:hypothetical protein
MATTFAAISAALPPAKGTSKTRPQIKKLSASRKYPNFFMPGPEVTFNSTRVYLKPRAILLTEIDVVSEWPSQRPYHRFNS